ncbi:hypothetical protein D3C71_1797320 [compost metagenome]
MAENSQPPRAIGPTMEAISKARNKGSTASTATLPEASSQITMERSSMITSRDSEKLPLMIDSKELPRLPPKASRPPAPASMIARVLSSRERAIWPFSRDSRRRFSVGSSLLSAPLSDSAMVRVC